MAMVSEFYLFVLISVALWQPCPAPGDYGAAGGPLAKSARKPPQSKTRTTQFPDVDEGPQDPSFKDPNAKIDANIVKQNVSIPSVSDKVQIFPASAGEYGDMCCWEPHQGQTLNDIAQGRLTKPFYGFIAIETCNDPNACAQKCTKERCNYATWFSSNNSAALYAVHKDKKNDLTPANFTKTDGVDSLIRRCLRQYDLTPTCTDLVGTSCPICDEFIDFSIKYKKVYKGCDFLRRFEIFKLNKIKINSMNEKRVADEDASFGITKFFDNTHEEFVKSFLGARPDMGVKSNGDRIADPVLNVSGSQTLSLRFDWAEHGVIPKVRDQSDCGSCYAFTTTDLVAAQYAIDHNQLGKTYTLAPQYILDCFKEPAAYGCDGGRPVMVLKMLSKCGKKEEGDAAGCEFPTEACLPYQNSANSLCDKPVSCPEAPKIKVEKYNMVDISNDFLEKQKMAALINRGPLVVQVDANDAWQFYQEGVIRASQCTTKTNHAVLVTGYDFGTAVPGYIIRNTWSDEWGHKGFVFLEAGVNACGVGQAVTYACTANCEIGPNFSKLSPQPVPPTEATKPPPPPPTPPYEQPAPSPPPQSTAPPAPKPGYEAPATVTPATPANPTRPPYGDLPLATAPQYTVAPGGGFPTKTPSPPEEAASPAKAPPTTPSTNFGSGETLEKPSSTTVGTWAQQQAADVIRDSIEERFAGRFAFRSSSRRDAASKRRKM